MAMKLTRPAFSSGLVRFQKASSDVDSPLNRDIFVFVPFPSPPYMDQYAVTSVALSSIVMDFCRDTSFPIFQTLGTDLKKMYSTQPADCPNSG